MSSSKTNETVKSPDDTVAGVLQIHALLLVIFFQIKNAEKQ